MRIFAAVCLLAAAAHAAPIPADKAALVGEWEGHGVTLSITSGGQVAFKRQLNATGSVNKSITGVFTGFEGNKMQISVFITTLSLAIDEPPHLDHGVWVMTVEGAKVLRKSATPTSEMSLKLRAEDLLRRTYAGDGVAVKSVRCPDETKGAFKCALTTELADTFQAQCVVDAKAGELLCKKIDAAFIDAKALVGFIEKLFHEKTKDKAVATCPTGVIVKNQGDVFYCALRAPKAVYKVKVTVKDTAGNVSVDF